MKFPCFSAARYAASCGTSKIGTHDIAHAIDLRITPDVVGGRALLAQRVAQRLKRYIETDLAAILEAVSDRLGRNGDGDGYAVYDVPLRSRRKGLAAGPNDPQRDGWVLRSPCLGWLQYPYLVRRLGRKAVELQGGNEGDDTLGRGLNGLGEAMRRRQFGIGKLIETARRVFKDAFVA